MAGTSFVAQTDPLIRSHSRLGVQFQAFDDGKVGDLIHEVPMTHPRPISRDNLFAIHPPPSVKNLMLVDLFYASPFREEPSSLRRVP